MAKKSKVKETAASDSAYPVNMAQNIELWEVDKLNPYAKNSRTHSDLQVAQIAASITEFGFTNPILVDGDNGIIAGHGRLMAAQRLDLKQVPVIPLTHLTEKQKKAYIIADNKLAENAGWDMEILAGELNELMEDNFNLHLTGFDDDEIDKIFDGIDSDDNDNEDNVTEIPAKVISRDGDVWVLGNHRLVCGDNETADNVDSIILYWEKLTGKKVKHENGKRFKDVLKERSA